MSVQTVDVVEVRNAAYRMAKVGTTGYDTVTDAVSKLNEIQLDALNLLTPYYGKIQAIDDLLAVFVKEGVATFTSGVLNWPSDYYGFISMWKTNGGVTVSVPKMKTNQIGVLNENSIRKPTAASPKIYFRDGNMILQPSNGDAGISMLYFRKPNDVAITTTPVESGTDDYEQVTAQTNYEWPYRAKNLLIYLMVQRLGVEMKEPILYEISQLGIKDNLTVNSAPSQP